MKRTQRILTIVALVGFSFIGFGLSGPSAEAAERSGKEAQGVIPFSGASHSAESQIEHMNGNRYLSNANDYALIKEVVTKEVVTKEVAQAVSPPEDNDPRPALFE